MKKISDFLKNIKRWILWVILGFFLLIIDTITTTINSQNGCYERNLLLIHFVGNPIQQLIIKIPLFIEIFFIIEICIMSFRFVVNLIRVNNNLKDNKNLVSINWLDDLIYILLVSVIILIIFYLMIVQVNNLYCFFLHHSFL